MSEWEVREIIRKVKDEDMSGSGCAFVFVFLVFLIILVFTVRDYSQVKENIKELQNLQRNGLSLQGRIFVSKTSMSSHVSGVSGMSSHVSGVSERERGLLGKLLGEVPDGFSGVVRVYLPRSAGDDAVLEYGGKRFYFPANSSGSSDSSQVTPIIVVPEEDKPCL